MIDFLFDKFFHLHNGKVSYLFYIMQNGELGHLYYGDELGDLTQGELNYIQDDKNKNAGTTVYSQETGDFSLGDHQSEFPIAGTSDFREGALNIEVNGEYLYPDFKFDNYQIITDKPRDLKFPTSYALKSESETLSINLMDYEHHLKLVLHYTIFKNSSAIVRSTELKNLGSKELLVKNIQSGILTLPDDSYNFLQLSGAWAKERHIKTRPLVQGITKIESLRGTSSHQQNPFIALTTKGITLNHGQVYASNLIYSGNFISQVEVDEWGVSRLMTGINPANFSWKLTPNGSFKTPESVFFYSGDGYNGLMNETHYFVSNHIIDRKWQHYKRPIVINNWEATYFDFNEKKLLQIAQEAKTLGIECFVLDDGWFGHRDDDHTSLGDWSVYQKKFPNGLEHFSHQLHQMGMQFGLWFEPEMVSPDTSIYKDHPDWIVKHPYKRSAIGRHQYVLDFANPEVVDNIFEQMKAVIKNSHVDYIKWDMNRYITEAYSPYLNKKGLPQGEFYHRYVKGVYSLYQKLIETFPDLLIEGCASGGGRYDLGILFYSPQIWPSDDSDASERLDILSGTLLAYPLSTFSNHVSAVPNEQIKRITSLKFRQDFAVFGPLGYELDLTKLSSTDKKAIQQQISWYKKYRDLLVNGQFSQLLPFKDTNTFCFKVSDKCNSIIGFYRKLARPNGSSNQYINVYNVDPNSNYLVNNELLSGRILSKFGLREPYQFNGSNAETAQLIGDFQSYIYQIVKKQKLS